MYRHTQKGWVIVVTCLIAILVCIFCSVQYAVQIPLTVAGAVVVALILLATLTVTVDDDYVSIKFGPGLIRKKFKLNDIESCNIVRNKWWYGWGIHLTPGGWLFNVGGLDAVELVMKNGRKYRIGTDEPEKLSAFIQSKSNNL
jgi:hypothetical protein